MPINMKVLIAEAFLSLSQQKNIDKITVKDLVETCNISRQTFYYHFQDIMEVIEWSMQQAMQAMLEKSLAATTPEEVLLIFISSAYENKDRIQKLIHSQRREQIEKMMFQAIHNGLIQIAHEKSPQLDVNYYDLELATRFYTYGIVGLLIEASEKKQVDCNKLAHQLNLLLSGKLIEFK